MTKIFENQFYFCIGVSFSRKRPIKFTFKYENLSNVLSFAYKLNCDQARRIYQTSHFFDGFIGLVGGQLKSFPNSDKLLNAPLIRNLNGVCTSVVEVFMMHFQFKTYKCLIHVI